MKTAHKKTAKKTVRRKSPEKNEEIVQPQVTQPIEPIRSIQPPIQPIQTTQSFQSAPTNAASIPIQSVPIQPPPVQSANIVPESPPAQIAKDDSVTKNPAVLDVDGGIISPNADPLSDFKEKMNKEEHLPSNMSSKKNFMWPILFIFVIAIAVLGGIFVYKQNANKDKDVNVVALTPTPRQPSPKPTVAEVDLSKYEIKILNGSELEGEAGRQKTNLEEEGFTISSIGNASESDYTKTIIQAKETVDKDFLDKLRSVLELSFGVGEQEDLPVDADSNIIVIIGSEQK